MPNTADASFLPVSQCGSPAHCFVWRDQVCQWGLLSKPLIKVLHKSVRTYRGSIVKTTLLRFLQCIFQQSFPPLCTCSECGWLRIKLPTTGQADHTGITVYCRTLTTEFPSSVRKGIPSQVIICKKKSNNNRGLTQHLSKQLVWFLLNGR